MASETDYASYGQFAWMYNADPQVHALIDQANAESWTADKLAAAIQGTGWWRTMVASERNWDAEIAQDPRTAQEKRDRKAEEITKQAQQMGVSLRPGVADSFADSVFRYGWTDIQLENSILSQRQYQEGQANFGEAATVEQDINQITSDYGISLTAKDKEAWIIKIEQGRDTADGFKAFASQQAANFYGWARSDLEAGLSMRQILAPTLNRVADELELDPGSINMTDSKWMRLLQASRDPKTGDFVRPAWSDIERTIRTDVSYGWDKTANARDIAATASANLAQTFGKVG